jgi:tRNA(Ile2) C34 agmatinyltransferase TiaS
MKFTEITESVKVTPGEYILHIPTNQVVLCGSFNRSNNTIKAMGSGRMITDVVSNFRKIQVGKKERKESRKKSRCNRCSKR